MEVNCGFAGVVIFDGTCFKKAETSKVEYREANISQEGDDEAVIRYVFTSCRFTASSPNLGKAVLWDDLKAWQLP